MTKRAVIIRLVCYLLMLAAVLAWPVRMVMHYDFPRTQPKKFLFPVKGTEMLPETTSLHLGSWESNLSVSGAAVPKAGKAVYVTLGKDPCGTVMPLNIYYNSKEIPKNVPFIRAHYLFKSQDRISFSVSFGRFHLPRTKSEEFGTKEIQLLVKVYADGTFQVEDLKVNGKFLKDF